MSHKNNSTQDRDLIAEAIASSKWILLENVEKTLHHFNLKAKAKVLTASQETFVLELKPKGKTKFADLKRCEEDIGIRLNKAFCRIEKQGCQIRLTLTDKTFSIKPLRTGLLSPDFQNSLLKLPVTLGYDAEDNMCIEDLAESPHLEIAGKSNSGKTALLHVLILALICRSAVNWINLIIIDLGSRDMAYFANLPHLSTPIVRTIVAAIQALRALGEEMERRRLLSESELEQLPYLVVVIDEFPSLVSKLNQTNGGKIVLEIINALSQHGRHEKIHLIIAAQNPTQSTMQVDLSNFAQIAFNVNKHNNSTTILGVAGAEKLSGKGTFLFKSRENTETKTLQGLHIPKEKIAVLIEEIITSFDDNYLDSSRKFIVAEKAMGAGLLEGESTITATSEEAEEEEEEAEEEAEEEEATGEDKTLADIIMWTLGQSEVSANRIMNDFGKGNPKAKEMLKKMEQRGIVGKKDETKPRKVLVNSISDLPDEILKLLLRSGYSLSDVGSLFHRVAEATEATEEAEEAEETEETEDYEEINWGTTGNSESTFMRKG
jgi:S-DNA-T family DNA segregation ATPase FtsK/SpoIIIE